jgi:hypothetical protein
MVRKRVSIVADLICLREGMSTISSLSMYSNESSSSSFRFTHKADGVVWCELHFLQQDELIGQDE